MPDPTLYAHACGACRLMYAVPSGKPLVLLHCPGCRQTPIHPEGAWHYQADASKLPLAIEKAES